MHVEGMKSSQEKESHSLAVHDSFEEKVVNGFKCNIEDLGQKWAILLTFSTRKSFVSFIRTVAVGEAPLQPRRERKTKFCLL